MPFARTPAHEQQPSHKLLLLHLCPPVSSPCLSVKRVYKLTVHFVQQCKPGAKIWQCWQQCIRFCTRSAAAVVTPGLHPAKQYLFAFLAVGSIA